ncbi:TonB-dependent receptor plug domain-containing protein [Rheinheimera nanhaiensis]|uniref:TonB-dependent receptor n=1 Tax=Rheinheimera nanhaiensis E407-8 TaxID=562729 RepID=I1DZ91_9GAMM|nr:TonB-dependent receptor [Rheinheimera nanhaiensis]GAB59369.1 TonB-dependent receptor [Rheinheimera nanhaiensis E407-8]
MYTNNKLSKAVRLAIAFGAASATAFTAQVTAAEEETAKVERIEVTGSRIKRTDMETSSPVLVLDRAAIDASGLLSIGDILQDIPAAGAALNTAFNNGGNGATNIDLRNLGAQRLLVLVNGRRWISSLGSTVDLNTIPSAAVERIEVLKDGASAVYGSDAIAGVVNIITRKDFEGVELSVYGGENASEGDGRQYSAELTFGITSAKGGLLFNMSHVTQQPVWAGDRDISAFGNSSTTEKGRIQVYNNQLSQGTIDTLLDNGYTNLGTTNTNPNDDRFDLVPQAGTGASVGLDTWENRNAAVNGLYNYAPDNYLITPQNRNSFYVQGYYDLADDLRLVSDFVITNRKSAQELAPMPVTLGSAFGAAASRVDIHANNIYNPFGTTLYGDVSRAAAAGFDPQAYTPYAAQRRFVEAGPRRYEQNDTTYRAMIGLEGSLGDAWTWDAHYIYGQNNQDEMTTGLLNLTRINQALGDNCNATTNCVPLNLFGGFGSITQEMIDYVSFDSVARSGLTLKDYAFNAGGDLFELPAGMVGMAVGIERREETGYDTPDPLTVTGESSGNQRDATEGGFRLDEAYVEFSIPVLEMLTLTPAMRFSDHSTFGNESTAKVGLELRPMDDLLIRGTWAQGYRAPSISNLFAGNADSYPTLTDPCNTVTATGAQIFIDVNGVPTPVQQALPGCAGVPQGYRQSNTQIRITQVSSPDLSPETSTSNTIGFVYNPSWVEGLEMTVDYYSIEVEDSIGRYGAPRLLTEYAAGDAFAAQFIDRDPNTGFITDIRNFLQNSGKYEVEGVDAYFAYRMPETEFGTFKFAVDIAHAITNKFDGEEQLGVQYGDAGYPEWKGTFSIDWMMGNWDAHWDTRWVDKMDNYYTVAFGLTAEDGVTEVLPSYFVHDVSVGYTMDEYNTRFTFGIENLFAKEPRAEYLNNDLAVSTNNFSVTEYDPNMDRYVYFRATVKF